MKWLKWLSNNYKRKERIVSGQFFFLLPESKLHKINQKQADNMDIMLLFKEYIKGQFFEDSDPVPFGCFEYRKNEDGNKEIFFVDKDETFLGWNMEFMPDDPGYSEIHKQPLLLAEFPVTDAYDELTLFHLQYTLNSAFFSAYPNKYNKINVFMKQYCFFQLSQINYSNAFADEEYEELRKLFWFFFLYTHPVNWETLHSCTFDQGKLKYNDKLFLSEYFDVYHDFFLNNYETLKDRLNITQDEIVYCKSLTSDIVKIIEGKGEKLLYPAYSKDEDIILKYINDIVFFLDRYNEDSEGVFIEMLAFAENNTNSYRDFLLSIFLQNYLCYILRKDFRALKVLSDFLEGQKNNKIAKLIINKIFSDSIFAKKICRDQNINISDFQYIISLFDEESKRINLS